MEEIWLTSWYGKYPIIYRVSYIPGGAGFLPSTVGSMYSIFTYMWLIFMVHVGKYTIHGSYGIVHLKISRWKRRFLLETSIFRSTILNFGGVFFHLLFIVISIPREDCLYLTDISQTSWNHQPVDFWKLIEHPQTKTWHLNNISWNHQEILNLHKPSWKYNSTFFILFSNIQVHVSCMSSLCTFPRVFLMENVQPKTQDDEEAILRANSTKYGLGASIWSENLEKAQWKAEIYLQFIILKADMFIFPICSINLWFMINL